jgi:hypothetical protein
MESESASPLHQAELLGALDTPRLPSTPSGSSLTALSTTAPDDSRPPRRNLARQMSSLIVPAIVLDSIEPRLRVNQNIETPLSSDIEMGSAFVDSRRPHYYCQICLIHEELTKGFKVEPCGHVFCKEVLGLYSLAQPVICVG